MTAARIHPLFNALSSGSQFRQYRLLEQIGVGGEGVVWSALDQDKNQIHAIKFNEIPDIGEGEAIDASDRIELERLVKLQQAHILPILDYGFETQLRFTVTPYLPCGTLTQRIKMTPLSIEEIVRCGMQIASALDYLHAQGVVHRDLKSQNILLDLRNNCYLTDFGLARLVSTSTIAFHTGHGTPPYASPEQIQSRPLTHKSDLFSFGILLYEMFTGQLPWNGKKQLGVEQLTSEQELPDPREFNSKLPFVLTEVLRRITSANPDLRPPSATETMRVVRLVLSIAEPTIPREKNPNGWNIQNEDVEAMLKTAFAQWKATEGTYSLGLTKFALVDLKREVINMDAYHEFLLSQALTYAYHDDQWWQAVRNPRERLAVASRLLRKQNEVITSRVVAHLTGDSKIGTLSAGLPENITTGLLTTGVKTENAFLRREIFDGLRTLTPPKNTWEDHSTLDRDQAQRLAAFALEDSEFGDTAAELIGHVRSVTAVRVLMKSSHEDRKVAALLLIRRTAGSLPNFVSGNLRLRLSMEWLLQHLLQEPVSLIGAYMLALVGSALGIGLQVYLTYNLPNYLDAFRITTSLEQGLIVGAIFGLGIFSTRVIMERFQSSPAWLRLLAGTGIGAIGLNVALLIFHMLFLNTPPHGFLITAACLLIAAAFAIGGLLRSRLMRMVLASVVVFVAVGGTWWLHVSYAANPTDLTPIFIYDYAWPMISVALLGLIVAIPIGILGNLVNLSITEK